MNLFTELLSLIKIDLKNSGFTKSGTSFVFKYGKNQVILNFQKSNSSSKDEVVFTVNCGIYSDMLNLKVRGESLSKPTTIDCHWQHRIGAFFNEGQDKWWTISNPKQLKEVADDVCADLKGRVVPTLINNCSDEKLKELFLNGKLRGTNEYMRVVYVTSLMIIDGDTRLRETTKAMLAEVKGTSIESVVADHLKEFKLL
ncbi:DUF4304 domain-containing protein [Sphingobacterium detergens]|uniref:Uncharacterized protein DUF4304 n=1 Tax=Sphingobacterium detergens TaxID=1145106 RepID=A0A420B6S9_SPHD1|nr:DUF4304 domain-containing protein [Sphingobacterium detergens]RKE52417.1 uncharacterized protein DUF4304 [Sphingobacterium detergens]